MDLLSLLYLDLLNNNIKKGDSEIWSIIILARKLPARTDGCNWVLKYSTSADGYSLRSLIRKVADVSGPMLMLIQVLQYASKRGNGLDPFLI